MTSLEPYLKQIDSILVMTVNPGFGGQSFIKETLPKIQQADRWRREKRLKYGIAVDGGINFTTAVDCARAGADILISGTTLFEEKNMRGAVSKMRRLALQVAPGGSDSTPLFSVE